MNRRGGCIVPMLRSWWLAGGGLPIMLVLLLAAPAHSRAQAVSPDAQGAMGVGAASGHRLGAGALAAEAQAARDARRWDDAIALYQEGERRFPRRGEFAVGHIKTLADAGRNAEAIAQGQARLRAGHGRVDDHLALAYAFQMDGQPYPALYQAMLAWRIAPNVPYVQREYIRALRNARLPAAAAVQADAHPDLLDTATLRGLQADEAAQQTRMAARPARGESERYAAADRALGQYSRLIPEWQEETPASADAGHRGAPERAAALRRLRADRLQALLARRQPAAVVAAYEAMQSEGDEVPDYVLNDVASAYLDRRQPEKAAVLYRRALAARDPDPGPAARLNAQIGLAYALAESGQFEQADATLQTAVAEQPAWLYYKGNAQRQPNDLRLQADLARAKGLLYAGDTQAAQARLDQMADDAPANSHLRAARAEVYRARDLPRASERELKIAESADPRAIEVEVGQAETALALQEWEQARILRDDLVARDPANTAVQRLDRDWAVHQMSELQVTAGYGRSTDNPVQGTHDWNIDTVVYSPPISDHWRGFAGLGYSTGEFAEGRVDSRWARGGVQWRGRDLTVQAEVSANRYGHGTRAGGAVSAAWELDDHWQVGGEAAVLSRETPLRALGQDIRSNRVTAFLRWRGDERREWRFAVSPSHFTDGNDRLEITVSGRHRLMTTPFVQLDALLDVSGSHNSQDDAPYFNPRSDVMVLPALQLTHTLYQRYDTHWEQRVLLGAGAYHQQGYGTGGVVTLGYGQRVRWNRVLEAGIMVTGTSRPYDGRRERDLNVFLDLTMRF